MKTETLTFSPENFCLSQVSGLLAETGATIHVWLSKNLNSTYVVSLNFIFGQQNHSGKYEGEFGFPNRDERRVSKTYTVLAVGVKRGTKFWCFANFGQLKTKFQYITYFVLQHIPKPAKTACTKRSWWWTDEVRNMSKTCRVVRVLPHTKVCEYSLYKTLLMMDRWGPKHVELTKVMNKTYSLRPHCVSCWTTYV